MQRTSISRAELFAITKSLGDWDRANPDSLPSSTFSPLEGMGLTEVAQRYFRADNDLCWVGATVLRSTMTVFICFTGSTSRKDWFRNFTWVTLGSKNGASRGFTVRKADRVKELIRNTVTVGLENSTRMGLKVWRTRYILVGHSRGGAVCTTFIPEIADVDMRIKEQRSHIRDVQTNAALVTFGSPKPGNKKLKSVIERLSGPNTASNFRITDNLRFVMRGDKVADTPPGLVTGAVHVVQETPLSPSWLEGGSDLSDLDDLHLRYNEVLPGSPNYYVSIPLL